MKPAKNSYLLKLTPPQILVVGFASMIFLGTILLSLPIASKDHQSLHFIDALFTTTSAACVTGLVVVDTGTHFTVFGQMVILGLIEIGGLGIMTMATLVALVFRKRISLKERLILQEAMNQTTMEGIVRLIRKVMFYALAIQSVGAILFTIRWSFDMPFTQAFYFGIFHSISFFNNGGFDLFGLIDGPFSGITRYVDDFYTNIVTMLLIILGGIGFIVISDVLEFRKRRRFSLHTKMVITTSSSLIVLGALVIFIFELSNPLTLGPLNPAGKVLGSFFQSITPRTAGANTLDIASMRQATQFFIIILMFIGASPGSTGGGIKTTTFTIMVGAIIAMIRGKEDIVLFRQRLAKDRIFKAITLTMIALFLVIFSAMVLSTTEDYSFLKILFEVTSAFGTVGLSMGLTSYLSLVGKIMIILMMFIGRLGPITLAYAIGPKQDKELFRYPEGKVTIG